MENDSLDLEKYNIQFAKADNGKLAISLVPTQIIRDVAEVRMYGNKKYNTTYNWILVDKERYKDAMLRHILAFLDDEDSVDEESGIPHYKHIATNIAFICEMKRKDWKERRQFLVDHDPDLQKQIQLYIKQHNLKGDDK